MKLITSVIVTLLVTTLLSTLMFANIGAAKLAVFGYMIDTSISSIVAVILFFCLALYLLFKIFFTIWELPKNILKRHTHQLHIKSEKKLNLALLSLELGQTQQAEKLFLTSAKHNAGNLINYLKLAEIAFNEKKIKRAEKFLQQAREEYGDQINIINFFQAQLISLNEPERSNELIKKLKPQHQKHPKVISLTADNHFRLNEYKQLHKLIPELEASASTKAEEVQKLEEYKQTAARAVLDDSRDFQRLQKNWKSLRGTLQTDAKVLLCYTKKRLEFNKAEGLYELLSKAIPKSFDHHLLDLWVSIGEDADQQLRLAEKWIKTAKDNTGLLFCCAKLCMKLELWGKALDYLQTADKIKKSLKFKALMLACHKKLGQTKNIENIYKEIENQQNSPALLTD